MASRRIYLVPGFFGFANLGELKYFGHVRNFLRESCRARHVSANIVVVRSRPTASLRVRSSRILETIARVPRRERGPIHLIGHSSGGLDVRLVSAPGVSLLGDIDVEPIARRICSVVSVATPHLGTPVASFFAGLLGRRLLKLLSLGTMYVLRFGSLPLSLLLRLGAEFARVDRQVGLNSALLDQLFEQLLRDFSPVRRRIIGQLLGDIGSDQSLLLQLTPEAMDVFAAAVRDRPGVRYGSVVTQARSPGVRSAIAAGTDPSAHATHLIYNALFRLASTSEARHVPALSAGQERALRRAYRRLPARSASDGVVPTLSQVRGDVVHAAWADHLDVIGHFDDRRHRPPHYDWLSTGTGFDRSGFEAVWTSVLEYLLASEKPEHREPR